jgi:hypothetical protein
VNRHQPNTELDNSLWTNKRRMRSIDAVALRNCTVSVSDLEGIEHTVEVTAATLFEAVAAALTAFREDEWVGQIGNGLTTVGVSVHQPAVEHRVRVKDFLAWLKKKGGSPAEVSLREKLTKMLG